MEHYSDDRISGLIPLHEAIDALAAAFRALAEDRARVQRRMMTAAADLRLNTMAAIDPDSGYCVVKTYTALGSRFSFIIVLFSARDGRVLATFDAAELTRLRTAAVTCLAARFLARSDAGCLTVFGTGNQALGHATALVQVLPIERIQVVSRGDASAFAERVSALTGIAATPMSAQEAVRAADVVVTATRSAVPLFDGGWIAPGCFIAAVGSAYATDTELDALAVSRCSRVAVEAIDHARHEAGDLIHAERAGAFDWRQALPLGDLVLGRVPGRVAATEITLFKSVGCAVEDVAIAALAYQKLRSGTPSAR